MNDLRLSELAQEIRQMGYVLLRQGKRRLRFRVVYVGLRGRHLDPHLFIQLATVEGEPHFYGELRETNITHVYYICSPIDVDVSYMLHYPLEEEREILL